jgi:hypothetical protein
MRPLKSPRAAPKTSKCAKLRELFRARRIPSRARSARRDARKARRPHARPSSKARPGGAVRLLPAARRSRPGTAVR